MKRYWTMRKLSFVALLIIIAAAIPFLINESYKNGEGYTTAWRANDVLSFYGNVLCAVATIVGIFFTLDYGKYKKRQEEILEIKPILFTEYSPVYDFIQHIEGNGKTIFIKISFDEISYTRQTPQLIQKAIKRNEEMRNTKEVSDYQKLLSQEKKFYKKYYIIKYLIDNVGGGVAINVRMQINALQALQEFVLKSNSQISLIMIIDSEKIAIGSKKTLDIKYEFSDLYERKKYLQREKIAIKRLDDGTLSSSQKIEDILSKPKDISI